MNSVQEPNTSADLPNQDAIVEAFSRALEARVSDDDAQADQWLDRALRLIDGEAIAKDGA